MKCLTVRQPWASLIARGYKTIETRSWRTHHRGPLAIHAGVSWEPGRLRWFRFEPYGEDSAKAQVLESIGVDTMDDGWGFWRAAGRSMPRGAIVATATLVDCIPIVGHCDIGDPECIVVHDAGLVDDRIPWPPPLLDHCIPGDGPDDRGSLVPPGAHLIRDISDQLPYGDFTSGRWAWLLDDVVPMIPPVPAKGRQGLWYWTPAP